MTSEPYLGKGDVIFATLRDLITRGEMLPGEPLRQRDLAARFNVSSTPVREALRRLESQGLVQSDPHRGARVAWADDEDEEESYRILAALEPMATALAIERMTDRDLEEIKHLEREFDACAEDDPLVNERNRDFHFRIYACARSPLLLSLMRLLWHSFSHRARLRRPHAVSVREHREIVRALEARDGERAVAAIHAHALGSIDYMTPGSGGADQGVNLTVITSPSATT